MHAQNQQNSTLSNQAPTPQSEIASQLTLLEQTIDRMGRMQGLLRQRLMPVSIGIPPHPTAPAAVAKALGSDVGRTLSTFNDRLNAIADSLDEEITALAI